MTKNEIIDVASAFFSKKRRSLKEIPDILKIVRSSSLKKNVLVYQQGEVPKKVVGIVKGITRWFYIDEKGKENTTKFSSDLEPSVPLLEFEQGIPSINSIITQTATKILWISKEDYLAFLNKYPRYQPLIKEKRNQTLLDDIEMQKMLRISTATERYKALVNQKPKLIKQVPLLYLASYLDIAPETLSRIRAKIS